MSIKILDPNLKASCNAERLKVGDTFVNKNKLFIIFEITKPRFVGDSTIHALCLSEGGQPYIFDLNHNLFPVDIEIKIL